MQVTRLPTCVWCGVQNSDGALDIIVTNWGGPLLLFLNDGAGTFTENATEMGLGSHPMCGQVGLP